jgi:hypothetical protein
MRNKDRDFSNRFEAYEAYCAEVLLRGSDKGFWEKYRDDGPDIEKYISRDWEEMERFLDWLFAESTEEQAVPDSEEDEDEDPPSTFEDRRDDFLSMLSRLNKTGGLFKNSSVPTNDKAFPSDLFVLFKQKKDSHV